MGPMDARRLKARTREALRHHRAGRLAEARKVYEALLEQAPGHAPALHGIGSILHAGGEHEPALAPLRKAIERRPDSPIYRNTLGNVLRALGRGAEAEASYRQALRADPRYALAAYNLGVLLLDRGELDAARSTFEDTLARDPRFGAAALALGGLLRRQGRIDEAIACQERLVDLEPDRASVYNDLGALYQLKGRVEEALRCFERALELDPASGEAHFNRGKLLADLSRFEAARGAFERAIPLASHLAVESACHLAVVRRHLCDWSGELERTAELARQVEAMLREQPSRGLPPLALNVVAVPATLRLAVARHLASGLERESRAARERLAFRHPTRSAPKRLRVGYVSPDFRTHAVGTLIHDVFRHHDRNAVAVHAYSLVVLDDPFQRRVRQGVDAFVDVSRDAPEAIARRIHADRIDVLVDLAGYTTYSKTAIFALRPAPVQAHWLGYLDTMGADFLPYLLADDRVVPEWLQGGFSETVVSLPHGFSVSSELPIAEAPPRAELGLPEDAFVFCCMNGLHKLDAATFDVWMRILARVPESVLWLPDEGSQTARANLVHEAEARGVDPSRLHFARRAPLPAYLARYRAADLFLDTFAYNAGATAVGALRAGLPLLTKPGETFMSRMGASLCEAAGIPDTVCADAAAYEERAVALATQPAELEAVRRRLEAGHREAPLFDPRGFARQLEAAYRAMWRHHVEGGSSRRIRVETPARPHLASGFS